LKLGKTNAAMMLDITRFLNAYWAVFMCVELFADMNEFYLTMNKVHSVQCPTSCYNVRQFEHGFTAFNT